NLASSIGAFIFAFGTLLLLINIVRSLREGERAGPNPWDAPTLEWATSSPPPPYNFLAIPIVASRHPLWEDRLRETDERSLLASGVFLEDGKKTLGVTALDAEPAAIIAMPGDSLLPVILALAISLVFAGMLVTNWWAVGIGALVVLVTLLVWTTPTVARGQEREALRD